MILADTSVWVDHFRSGNPRMQDHLKNQRIVMHPFVAGELALGSLPDRIKVLVDLDDLPQLLVAEAYEIRELIERRKLYSTGIGWIDTHLVACLLMDASLQLWTTDKRLARIVAQLGLPLYANSLPN